MADAPSGGWHQSASATSGLTNYDLRVPSTARRRGRRARRGSETLLLATDFGKVYGMDTQLDLMIRALGKSVVSILDAPVSNRRDLLKKTVSQFRSAAVDYIEEGLAKAYSAGEGSALAKRMGRTLRKDHNDIQSMASILAQVEDLMGRLARNSYDKPELLTALQGWMAEGSALLSEMANAGVVESAAGAAPVDYPEVEGDAVDIEAEVEKFARSLSRKLRKAAEESNEDDDFDFEDEDDDIEEEVEKFARVIARKLQKAVDTEGEDIEEPGEIADNDLDFDLDEDPDYDDPRLGDMVDIAPTEAYQVPDDDEVTGAAQYSPDLEAEVEKFARVIARKLYKAVDKQAEKIEEPGETADNDLDFDLDEDPDEDDPVEGDMTGISDPHASRTLEDDEVTGVAQYSPDLEAEVAKFVRRIAHKMSAGHMRKQSLPMQAGGGPNPPMQGEDMESQQVQLDSPEIIGRLSAAIFDEAAKLKQEAQQEQAQPQSPMAQGNPMDNQGFGKLAGGDLNGLLRKAAQNVLSELKNTPAPAKGVLRKVVSKTDDAADLAKSYGIDLEAEAERLEKMDPESRAAELIKFAHRNPRPLV